MSCKQYQSIEIIDAVPEIQLVSMLFQVVNSFNHELSVDQQKRAVEYVANMVGSSLLDGGG